MSARGRWLGIRELAIFSAGYLTYFGVRAVTEGSVAQAVANADWIDRVERFAGINWEHAAQAAVLGHDVLVRVANWIYIFGHWPLLLLAGVLLFRYRPHEYLVLRNVCLISGAVGLVIFALFPVAPPRLAGVGIDTVTRYASGYRSVFPAALVNQYAAMPSFHAGWNVLLGIVIFRASERRALRGFAVLMPTAMVLAVVVTANHFILDVVVGTLIVVSTLLVVDRRERRLLAPTLACDAAGRSHLRHRPWRSERPRGHAPRAAARHPSRRS
jgi:PAP2 superfamily